MTIKDEILFLGCLNWVRRNEQTEVLTKEAWNDKVRASDEKRLELCKRISKFYVPILVLIFVISWWFFGIFMFYTK